MHPLDEYDIKIADYFENRMTTEEEACFLKDLDSHPQLRDKFNEELLLRAILRNRDEDSKNS